MESKFNLYDKNYRKESPLISLREAEATQRKMTTTLAKLTPSTSSATSTSTSTSTSTTTEQRGNTAVSILRERKKEK